MNFFRRTATSKSKDSTHSSSALTARQEKERNGRWNVSDKEKEAVSRREEGRLPRQREYSTGRSSTGRNGGASNEGRMFGKWLNTGTDDRPAESSQASIRSKKSFFKIKSSASPVLSPPLSAPSSSSSPSPASTSNPAFSPVSVATSTEHDGSHAKIDNGTKTLATRLQELAIANADGLLDQDEYRILRQQVFQTHSNKTQSQKQVDTSVMKLSEGSVAVPRLNGSVRSRDPSIRATTFTDYPASPSTPPTNHSETLASPVSSPLRAPSVVSHQSKRHSILPPLNSLFRRDSSFTTTPIDSDWDVVTPPLVSPQDLARSPSPLPLPYDSHSVFSGRSHRPTLSPPTSPARNRSIRNHPGLASSAMDSQSSSYFAGSSRSSNGRSYGGGGESVLSGAGRSSLHAPRSPTSVRTRSYYGGGGGPSSSLSHGYSSNQSHDRGSGVETLLSHSLPPITSSTDPLLFAATGREPTAEELAKEIKEIEEEWERMRESWRDIVRNKVEVWERQVGEPVARQARESIQKDNDRPNNELSGTSREGGGTVTGKKGLFRRASFLSSHSLQPSSAAAPSTPSTTTKQPLPPFLLSTRLPFPPDFEAKLSPHQIEPTLAFRATMEEIADRQRRTEEKYERRLEFLRAKETGARIKQGLLK